MVFQGLGTPRQHTLIKESMYFEPRFADAYAERDVERANQILDELGLAWDANREWRLQPDGNRFSVIMDTGNAVLPIHELAVEQWKEIGMEVTMKSFSYQQSEERSKTNQMQLYGGSAGFNARSEAFVASPLFFLPQRQGWENPWGNQWALWYVSGGDGGIEPPDEVKRNIERWEGMTATQDLDEKIDPPGQGDSRLAGGQPVGDRDGGRGAAADAAQQQAAQLPGARRPRLVDRFLDRSPAPLPVLPGAGVRRKAFALSAACA